MRSGHRQSATDRLAAQVAAGRAVDWQRELAEHPGERRQIENLRRVAELAERGPAPGPGPPS